MSNIYDPQSQNDPRWRNLTFGFGGASYGRFACFVTAFAMQATHYLGRLVLPTEINTRLRATGGYAPGSSNVYWNSISKAFLQIQSVGNAHLENVTDVNVILGHLNDADDVEQIIEVDYTPGPPVQTHFVRYYGRSNGRVIIDDPWDGVRRDLVSKYGDLGHAVQWIGTYRVPGFVPPWKPRPPVKPPVQPPIVVAPDPLVVATAKIAELTSALAIRTGQVTAKDAALASIVKAGQDGLLK